MGKGSADQLAQLGKPVGHDKVLGHVTGGVAVHETQVRPLAQQQRAYRQAHQVRRLAVVLGQHQFDQTALFRMPGQPREEALDRRCIGLIGHAAIVRAVDRIEPSWPTRAAST